MNDISVIFGSTQMNFSEEKIGQLYQALKEDLKNDKIRYNNYHELMKHPFFIAFDEFYKSTESFYIAPVTRDEYLYRARISSHGQKEKFSQEADFLRKSVNRMDPPPYSFFSYSDTKPKINKKIKIAGKRKNDRITSAHLTCIVETRCKPGTQISIAKFRLKNENHYLFDFTKGDILPENVEKIAEKEILHKKNIMLARFYHQAVMLKGLQDPEKFSAVCDSMIKDNKELPTETLSLIVSHYISKAIFKYIEGDYAHKKMEYAPSHAISSYIQHQSKRFDGIIYKSTRMDRYKTYHKNVVLFDPDYVDFEKDQTIHLKMIDAHTFEVV